jgi:hypothetical protein
MPKESDPRELKALDAIIAASLAGQSPELLSDEDVLGILDSCPKLSPEGEAILKRLGPKPFTVSTRVEREDQHSVVAEPAGMYREGSDAELPPEIKAEIEKKRAEILARLQSKRDKNV